MGAVLGWSWTTLAGLAGAFAFYLGQAPAGITLILSAFTACPLAAAMLERRTGARPGGRLALVVIFAGLAGVSIGQNPAAWQKLLPHTVPPRPKTLLEQVGQFGNKTTPVFTPQGADWNLEWSFDCSGLGDSGIFNAQIMRQDGGASGLAGVDKINDRDSGREHYRQAGSFSLKIVSECRWSVKISG